MALLRLIIRRGRRTSVWAAMQKDDKAVKEVAGMSPAFRMMLAVLQT
jgi:hypothetical protein